MSAAAKKTAVYRILNLASGTYYVGSSTNLYERWRTHRKKLRAGTHPNHRLQSSWIKHGEERFSFTILAEFESVADMEACEESLLIEFVLDPLCCNLSTSATTPWRSRGKLHPRFGISPSEDVKERLRQATLEQWKTSDPRTGRKHSNETRDKLRLSAQKVAAEGRGGCFIPSEETRAKMSAALKGNQNAKGHVRTEEHRRKLSEANKGSKNFLGKHHSEEAKAKMGQAVRMISPDGAVTEYLRTTAIKEQFGIFLPTIQRSVRSGNPLAKGPYKGWRFEYV